MSLFSIQMLFGLGDNIFHDYQIYSSGLCPSFMCVCVFVYIYVYIFST